MKSFLTRNPVTTGAVAIAATTTTIALALNINRLPLVGAGPTYRAVFADASGLVKDEQVRVAGIKVGSVSKIALEGDHVVVSFHVKDVPLGVDTTASIEIKTMLGQHYLAVTPAGPGRLRAGSEIPLERTSVPTNIVPAIQQLTTVASQTDTGSLATAFETIAQSLNTASPQIKATLDGLSRLSATIASRDHELGELLTHAKGVTQTIAGEHSSIDQILQSSNEVLAMLAGRRDTIREIVTGTEQLATQLRGLIGDNAALLTPALTKLHEVQAVLDKDQKQLDTILTTLPGYYRIMMNVVGSGRWFDAVVTPPAGLQLCDTSSNALSHLIDPVLNSLSSAAGSSGSCLPLSSPASKKGTR
jgi:phospholipid/cholesterol/gamma-HCH transport system substrate-binding protein